MTEEQKRTLGLISRLGKMIQVMRANPSQTEDSLDFRSAGTLTLGAEWELQVMDKATWNLTPKAELLLQSFANSEKVKPELYLDMIELNTGKCNTVQEIEKDLKETAEEIKHAAEPLGIAFAGCGSHPMSDYNSADIYPSARYNELIDRNQWLTRRWKVYGLHIHIGMKSGDDCIRFNNFFMPLLPIFLALSAGSPFWQGQDTGLATCRPTIYEALPTAGQPYPLHNWGEFAALCETLRKSGAIKSLKDLWWDVRPSPKFGTLEIRVCDSPATLKETVAITAFVHVLAHWFQDHGEWLHQVPQPPHWMMRENKWRVIRHGLDAQLIVGPDGENRPIKEEIALWLEKTRPYAKKLGYGSYMQTVKDICAKGGSVERQRGSFTTAGDLQAVARQNAAEFALNQPVWAEKSLQKAV